MLDWIWQSLALLAGAAALWFGFRGERLEKREARERADREAAMREQVESALKKLERTKAEWANKAPVNQKKRTDFEDKA